MTKLTKAEIKKEIDKLKGKSIYSVVKNNEYKVKDVKNGYVEFENDKKHIYIDEIYKVYSQGMSMEELKDHIKSPCKRARILAILKAIGKYKNNKIIP